MSEFKWRHYEGEIILWAVRWYCRYGISYRDLEQMMGERNAGTAAVNGFVVALDGCRRRLHGLKASCLSNDLLECSMVRFDRRRSWSRLACRMER